MAGTQEGADRVSQEGGADPSEDADLEGAHDGDRRADAEPVGPRLLTNGHLRVAVIGIVMATIVVGIAIVLGRPSLGSVAASGLLPIAIVAVGVSFGAIGASRKDVFWGELWRDLATGVIAGGIVTLGFGAVGNDLEEQRSARSDRVEQRRRLEDSPSLANRDLTAEDLSELTLVGKNLRSADLTGARLTRADLTDADLSGARLSGADLTGVNLNGADLTCADLAGAKMSGTDLRGAIISRTNLSGVNLLGVPRKLSLRSWFDPSDGYRFAYVDAATSLPPTTLAVQGSSRSVHVGPFETGGAPKESVELCLAQARSEQLDVGLPVERFRALLGPERSRRSVEIQRDALAGTEVMSRYVYEHLWLDDFALIQAYTDAQFNVTNFSVTALSEEFRPRLVRFQPPPDSAGSDSPPRLLDLRLDEVVCRRIFIIVAASVPNQVACSNGGSHADSYRTYSYGSMDWGVGEKANPFDLWKLVHPPGDWRPPYELDEQRTSALLATDGVTAKLREFQVSTFSVDRGVGSQRTGFPFDALLFGVSEPAFVDLQ